MDKLTKHLGVRSLPVYGGASINVQIDHLRRGVHVVVGTPGRIMDHMERGTLRLDKVKIVVLDEADRMLDMGFVEDMDFILAKLPPERQTMLFSATMEPEILKLTHKYMRHPQEVRVSKDEISVKEISHSFAAIRDARDRFRAMCAYLHKANPKLSIVFTRTKFAADNLVEGLRRVGYKAEALHGNLSQHKRDVVMQAFRDGHIHILVASDLAARGLDVSNVTHVINYNLPEDPGVYVHRTGRTGRVGRAGIAFSLAMPDQMGFLGQIERYAKISMNEEPLDLNALPPGFHNAARPSAPSHDVQGRSGGYGNRSAGQGGGRQDRRGFGDNRGGREGGHSGGRGGHSGGRGGYGGGGSSGGSGGQPHHYKPRDSGGSGGSHPSGGHSHSEQGTKPKWRSSA
jgi:superfamily II DNA/RNA helicase